MKNVEGELIKIEDEGKGESKYGIINTHTYKVLMTGAFEEDVIADLRERMSNAIKNVMSSRDDIVKLTN